MHIQQVVADIFRRENIRQKDDLKRYCGSEGLAKLWTEVQSRAPEHWAWIHRPGELDGWWFLQSILDSYNLYDPLEALIWLTPHLRPQVVGDDVNVEAEQALPVTNMDVLVARMNAVVAREIAVAARENAVAIREAHVDSALADIAAKRDT